MNEKEKAEELVNKFSNIQNAALVILKDSVQRNVGKQAALIAVQEIINANPHSNPFNTDVYSTMEYWLKVKKHIETL